jgi:hypothetical protein
MKETLKFITNEKGEKISAVIAIEEYEKLISRLKDLRAANHKHNKKKSGETPAESA